MNGIDLTSYKCVLLFTSEQRREDRNHHFVSLFDFLQQMKCSRGREAIQLSPRRFLSCPGHAQMFCMCVSRHTATMCPISLYLDTAVYIEYVPGSMKYSTRLLDDMETRMPWTGPIDPSSRTYFSPPVSLIGTGSGRL